jgi:hypothetical protein
MTRILVTLTLLIASGGWLPGTAGRGRADGPGQPRSTAGTRESKGCRLILSIHRPPMRVMPLRTSFRRGEPITLDLVLFNASERDLFIFLGGSFWKNHRIEVRDAHGQEAPLTELGERCRGLFSPGGAHNRGRTVPVAAGTRHGWASSASAAFRTVTAIRTTPSSSNPAGNGVVGERSPTCPGTSGWARAGIGSG